MRKQGFFISVFLITLLVGCGKPYIKNEANVKAKTKAAITTNADKVVNKDTDNDAVDVDMADLVNTWTNINKASAISVDKRKPAREHKKTITERVVKHDSNNIVEEKETITETVTPALPPEASIVYLVAMVIVLMGFWLIKNWLLALIVAMLVLVIIIIYKRKRR